MAIPKLALIPSGFKAGKLYSVLPTNGDGDFTTTRNTVATRVNENGLIEEVAVNVPRLDYSDGACPSLLLEPQRLNYVTQSETFTGYWGLQGASLIADNNVKNPTGNTFSNILNTTSTGTFKSINKGESSAWDSKTLTVSCFAKKKTNDFIYFHNIGSVSGSPSVFFNIGSGTLGSVGDSWSNVKIENYGNDWYRCSAKITFGADTNYIYISNSDGNSNTTSTVGSQTYLWGTQVEEGNYATSYIKTEGTVITRAADTASGSGNSTVINSTEGVLYFEGNAFSSTGSSGLISLNVGTTDLNNRVTIELDGANVKARFIIGGTSLGIFNYATDITQVLKIAVKYKANDFALWVNGAERVPITSGNSFSANTLSELDFNRGDGGEPFIGNTNDLRVYATALSDEELITLTTI
tara:strand:+ start:292 stop:1521 length:1230 start_codon:yes stop_codon:yes gene_type:complete